MAANPKTFFQIYWLGGRDAIAERAERARGAGAVGMIVTTDWSFARAGLGQSEDPREDGPAPWSRCRRRRLTRPRWFLEWAKTLRPPTLTAPTRARGRPGRPSSRLTASGWEPRPGPGEDIAWLREFWGGPFMLKGVMRIDDAKRAVDAGCTAIPVSKPRRQQPRRHPGHHPALPAIAGAVGDQVEVLLDGGVRRGSDVVKRRWHSGARAVMIGRAYLWGLAANGQAGVENVLDILSGGIDSRPARTR